MHIDWQRLFEYLYGNRLAIAGAFTVAATAAVRTMPPEIPKRVQDFWTWAYDWAHQFWNIRNDRQGLTPGK